MQIAVNKINKSILHPTKDKIFSPSKVRSLLVIRQFKLRRKYSVSYLHREEDNFK